MASIGEIKVPLTYEITEKSRAVLKALIAETIREALEGSQTVFPSEEALRAFVREEVRKALAEQVRTRGWQPYTPPGMETKEKPHGR